MEISATDLGAGPGQVPYRCGQRQAAARLEGGGGILRHGSGRLGMEGHGVPEPPTLPSPGLCPSMAHVLHILHAALQPGAPTKQRGQCHLAAHAGPKGSLLRGLLRSSSSQHISQVEAAVSIKQYAL